MSVSSFTRFRKIISFSGTKGNRASAYYAGSNLLVAALGLVGSLIQTKYIAPEEMGLLRTIGVVSGYLTFLHLGVFDGLQREIPIRLGRQDTAAASYAASVCLTWILFVTMCVAFVFGCLASYYFLVGKSMLAAGWLAYALVSAAGFYGTFLNTLYRSTGSLNKLSKASIIETLITFIALPAVVVWGYYGASLRLATGAIVNMSVLAWNNPMRVRPKIDFRGFWMVIKLGLPFSASGYLSSSLWNAIEGTFVLAFYGTKALGLFSVAVLVRTLITQFVQSITQLQTTNIYHQYGATGETKTCLNSITRPTFLAAAATIPFVVIGWILLPYAIKILIPNYADASLAGQISLLALPSSFLQLFGSVLRAAGNVLFSFVAVLVGLAVFVCLAFLLSKTNIGFAAIMLASVMGQLAIGIASYQLVSRVKLEIAHK